MQNVRACLTFLSLLVTIGCNSAMPGNNNVGNKSATANISISPDSVAVGSPDLTLTVTGSAHFTFTDETHKVNRVIWSGSSVPLQTSFISSTQLTAIVPASLLASALSVTVHVEIWDQQGDAPISESSFVPFQVTSAPAPTISSISPSTASVGGGDLTITIEGSNFGHFGHFIESTAFWTTNGNLHDTGTWLQTTIINSSQLTAVIPAKLLQSPATVQIVVMNGDVMGMSDGYFGYPKSNSVTFTVNP